MNWWWLLWFSTLGGWLRKAKADWDNVDEDRRETLALIGIFAAVWGGLALAIVVWG